MSSTTSYSRHTEAQAAERAVISVIERDHQRAEARNSSRLLSATLMTVFFVMLLAGMAAGATMYAATVHDQLLASDLHLQAGLVTNALREGDVAGAVHEAQGPEGPALVLERTLESGTYETRLYHYQGQVLQELAAVGRPYDPSGATPLLTTGSFSFVIEGSLVTFTCDRGSFSVALRSDPAATPHEGPATGVGGAQ